MPEILLVQIEAALRRQLEDAVHQRADLRASAPAGPDEALERLSAAPGDIAALVVGPGAGEPLRLAQRAHGIDRGLSVVLLADAAGERELRDALRLTPYLGEDVTCVAAADRDALVEGVIEAAGRRRRRQAYARTTAMMNPLIGEAVGSPQIASHFGRLLDHAPIGVITVDAECGIYGWNRHAQHLLDRPEHEVIGEPLPLLFASPEREQVSDYLTRAIHGAEPSPTTFDRSTSKGEPQHLELSAVAIDVDPGRPGAIVLLQDATAREQARAERDRTEEALRQQQRWFEATVLSIGDAVIATDEQGCVTLMNSVAERLTGWPLADAAGMDSTRVFHVVDEATRAEVESPVTRVIREGVVVGLANHTLLVARDGRELPIDDSGAPIRDSEGRITGVVLVFRDVSERRWTERALRESEQRFRAIFDQASSGIALVAPSGAITEVNERFCRLVGYRRDELLAMDDPIADLTHPDDLAIDQAQSAALATGEGPPFQLEKRYIHKDGHEVWVNLGASALRDEQGRIQQLIGIVEDIDERKRAEAALQASEERLRLILESLRSHAVFAMDRDGRITDWNTGARRLLGYEDEEIVGQPADVLFTEEDRRLGIPQGELREALEKGQAFDDRWQARKDGTHFWANGLTNTLRDDGEPRGFVKILRDETDAKQAQDQLKARARQQAAVARFGQRGLSGANIDSLLEEAAQLVARVLEVELCEVLRLLPGQEDLQLQAGVGWSDGLVGRARVGGARGSQGGYTLASEQPVVVEDLAAETRFASPTLLSDAGAVSGMTVVIAGGEERPWGVLGAHTRERRSFSEDDVNFLQAMANNLAAAIGRRETEQQLRELNQTLEDRVAERTAEAEQRAAQLRALTSELTQTEQRERRRLAQVLHDHLQQMLVAGKLQIGTALKTADDPKTAGALERVNELLDQSIRESRSLTVELSPPVLYEAGLTAGLQWLGRWMQEQHGLTVDVTASEDADPAGEDLAVLLFQAARELLFNAVKHARVDRAELTLGRDDDRRIEMSVRDRGGGFDPEAAEPSENKREGFGLFSIRERLARLDGELTIHSTPGEGTRAILAVPEHPGDEAGVPMEPQEVRPAEPAPAAAADSEASPSRSGRIRVILADDHDIVREGLVGVLNAQPDVEVVGEASDGRAAVELVRRSPPDVVVLDVTMPRMNGVEAARTITEEFPGIRVIGLSVHESADMAGAMRQAGAADYLNKAGPSNQLLAAIRGT